ncbi:MAG TPA: carboxypeptidase regulatory-like domain-containing protein, partial [Clostridia bacterium]|nr:carboxypeptidase regulatory-like domain-containing protein [Clostridia bacterium]
MNVFVTADGHVPMVTRWRNPTDFSQNYTMKLERGTTIAGIVVDEDGQPVPGVKVVFPGPGIDLAKRENITFGPDTGTQTDTAGRWSCTMIPKEFEGFSIVLEHPNFAVTRAAVAVNKPESTNLVLTIRHGVTVAGLVTDLQGQPIGGASVRQVHSSDEPKRSTQTDLSGQFALEHMNSGELMLAVQAQGFAPEVMTTNVSSSAIEMRVLLGPGQVLRGRVIDSQGKPVCNAEVRTDWDFQGQRNIEWSTKTDQEGRFSWDSAPVEPLFYWFEAEEFSSERGLQLQADGSEHEIKLLRRSDAKSVRITGTVVDTKTGQPLDDFEALIGESDVSEFPANFSIGAHGRQGKFSLTLTPASQFSTFQIQIQKDGYLPVVSTNLHAKDGDQVLEFRLRRGTGPSGVVYLPNGEPAKAATVFLYERKKGVYIDKPGHFANYPGTTPQHMKTDDSGSFSFGPKLDACGIIVIHEQGYAEVTLDSFYRAGSIFLQPWGRVEGKVLIGDKPKAHETVCLSATRHHYEESGRLFPALSLHLETTTDSDGNFIFEKVPPGERTVSRYLARADQQKYPTCKTHDCPISVAAGTVTQVKLGGTGRPVSGRLTASGFTNHVTLDNAVLQLQLKPSGYSSTLPKRQDYDSDEAFDEANKAYAQADRRFWTSEQGKALEKLERHYAAFADREGRFVFDDIPAGTYELKIELHEFIKDSAGPSPLLGGFRVVASVTKPVVVPGTDEGFSTEPLDIGILELTPNISRQ